MTLTQRREIVRRFMAGERPRDLCNDSDPDWCKCVAIETVLRDFMNGKFTMKPKKRGIRATDASFTVPSGMMMTVSGALFPYPKFPKKGKS